MLTYRLVRLSSDDAGTFGQILDAENALVCVTLELPWRDNVHDESCIPPGTYTARRYHSPKHRYDLFKLDDVPGRSDIELHIGNVVHDSLGCVLLGSNLGTVNGQPGITGSAAAFRRFMDRMTGVETFTLTVTDPPTITTHSSHIHVPETHSA